VRYDRKLNAIQLPGQLGKRLINNFSRNVTGLARLSAARHLKRSSSGLLREIKAEEGVSRGRSILASVRGEGGGGGGGEGRDV